MLLNFLQHGFCEQAYSCDVNFALATCAFLVTCWHLRISYTRLTCPGYANPRRYARLRFYSVSKPFQCRAIHLMVQLQFNFLSLAI